MTIPSFKAGFQPLLLVQNSVDKMKKKNRNLDALSIFDCEGAGYEEISLLIDTLKNTDKHLHNLKVTIKESMVATEKEFSELFFALSRLKELRHLDLNFLGCKKITDTIISQLCKQLGNFKQLNSLSLTLSSYYITNNSLIQIAKLIHKYKGLQGLSLKFTKCFELNSTGASYLLSKLQRVKDLNSLAIAFHECNQIKDSVVVSLTDLLPHLKKLKSFHCHFIFCGKITNQTVSKLAAELEYKKALKSLSFWFVVNESRIQEIKDLTLKKLFSSVGRLTYLEEISINVSVHEDTLKFIWDPLYLPLDKLKNLRKLGLHFSNNHRTTIAEISRTLHSIINPKQLEKLILDLSSRSMTDDDWFEISSTLKRFQNLQMLKVDLSKCPNITDRTFLNLLESIEKVKEVNDLTLSFGRCHQLTDESLVCLPKFLPRYQRLKSIDADFSRCLNITDEAIYETECMLASRNGEYYTWAG